MSVKIKLCAYGVLLILAIWFGWAFHSNYSAISRQAALLATNDAGDATSSAGVPGANTNLTAPSTGQTSVSNAVAGPGAATNDMATTNETAATNQSAAAGATSNLVDQASHPVAPRAIAPAAAKTTGPAAVLTTGRQYTSQRGTVAYLAALVGVLIGLGVLIAHDVTQYMGGRAVDFLFTDRGEGAREPEYEMAEKAWANGEFLEAIQMLRDYLKNNHREQHVALRIAEIYEKDLKNFLAAALEYEEVLKNKLPPERWGWAAIHLCNLYSKMGQSAKAMPLLERIATEYPKTAAAKKARARLGWAEPDEEQPQEAEPEAPSEPSELGDPTTTFEVIDPGDQPPLELEPPPPPPPPPPEPKSHLPPGFRPKK
jgi:TolA-binding protein